MTTYEINSDIISFSHFFVLLLYFFYFRVNCIFPPLSIGLFQSPPLSIKMSNVLLYLLKMYKLHRTIYFSDKSKQNLREMSKIPPLKLI